ncbi:hypothetical protein QE152_g10452 [Popillia japonica]|uniref:Uncharacterized protein n=1 Tax=Popillia japonica TaxID=7064 RepID=A0AAW1LRL7_POPJA
MNSKFKFTNKAFNRAFTRQNIINSFKKPGIWPVDRLAFSDEDFVASTVTDQPQKQAQNPTANTEQSETLARQFPIKKSPHIRFPRKKTVRPMVQKTGRYV